MLHCYVTLPECKWLLWGKKTKLRDSQPPQNRENLNPTSNMTTSAYPSNEGHRLHVFHGLPSFYVIGGMVISLSCKSLSYIYCVYPIFTSSGHQKKHGKKHGPKCKTLWLFVLGATQGTKRKHEKKTREKERKNARKKAR